MAASFGHRAFLAGIKGFPGAVDAALRQFISGIYAFTPPPAPTNVAASENNSTKVVVTWTKSSGATGYKIYRDGNLIDTVGDVATYDDTGAAAPVITPGSAVASDGTQAAHVALSLSGNTIANGTTHTYKVRATNATGDSADSSTDTGYRLAASLIYQWQRSAADSDASYSNIAGGTTASYNDTGAPADGSGRYFKCVLSATGSSNQTSAVDRGYRASVQTVIAGPISALGILGGALQVQLSCPVLSGHGVLDICDVAVQQVVIAPPLSSYGVLAGFLWVNLAAPEMSARATLAGSLQRQLSAPEMAATGNLIMPAAQIALLLPALSSLGVLDIADIKVTKDFELIIPPFLAKGIIAGNLSCVLAPPFLSAYGRLSAAMLNALKTPELAAAAFLRALRAASFADNDYHITYACVLSGMPDLILPMAQFSAELRADGMSYLSVVIPGVDYTEAIASRIPDSIEQPSDPAPPSRATVIVNYDPYNPAPGTSYYLDPQPPPPPSAQDQNALGNLSVYMIKRYASGQRAESLLISVVLTEVNFRRDAAHRQIILSGYKERAWSPKIARPEGPMYQYINGGKFNYRCLPAFDVHPGDAVIMPDGNTFTAGLISWAVSPGQQSMEIAEV